MQRKMIAHNKDGKFGDDLLDFMQAGRKLRRWYGENERQAEREERKRRKASLAHAEQDEDEDEGGGSAILVTDAEGALGEQVVLQLILARAEVKVLVKDPVKAKTAYGPYVIPVAVDIGNAAELRKALRGTGSVVAVGKLGALPEVVRSAGLAHVVLLSRAGMGSPGGLLGGMFQSSEESTLSDSTREDIVKKCGVPYSIVRSASIQQSPGGVKSIEFSQPTAAASASKASVSTISCEDLAAVIVATLRRPPAQGRVFSVLSAGPGERPSDWSALFNQLEEVATDTQAAASS
ncbi:hypothetical protein CEUSTIGMA_g4715.t1 [Chlamydomonas eustigma]|uniref:NAD(P)-binding domain-containing protein n=1 Tax=Chlamydomonas eustigma TaxID=1157962 RepID=A0A250X2V4_9CHLO|nr:hypothetical protein CEUSTIGMA_g4715.t1 [Chlamydomonas eustigma]|eukprot:GAX77269.1 hypothetical protein CEUSTIGMA_g4715.t1 [Chlamydomonas eustigma]